MIQRAATHRSELMDQDTPPLEAGDHLDQRTFHARYEAMPEGTRAELIGGVVYMPSPLKRPHGKMHLRLGGWLLAYSNATPGTEAFDSASAILGRESEPQPDLTLLIDTACGGQTHAEEDYIVGAPEWIGEIASSTESYDLHAKKSDYEKEGVREYVVVALRQARVFWFVNRQGKFVELAADPEGVFRSEVFPGLWLHAGALLRDDGPLLLGVLQQGLASAEHAAFVARLAAARTGKTTS